MALSLGDFFVKIGADITSFKAEMAKVGDTLKKTESDVDKFSQNMARSMGAMGVAVLGFGGLASISFASFGDALNEMSKRTGIAVETLSKLNYAAQLNGTSLEGLESGVKRLQRAITDATQGVATYQESFRLLGVDYRDLAGMSPEDQFMTVIRSLAGVSDATQRAALAQELLGRSGTQLIPIIADGAEGLDSMMRTAEELGLVMDKETAEKADNLADSLDTVKLTTQGLIREFGEGLAPLLTSIAGATSSATSAFSRWADANPVLASTISQMTMVVGGLMVGISALVVLGPKIAAVVMAISAALHLSLGPLGLALLAVTGLTAALLYLFNRTQAANEAQKRLALDGLQKSIDAMEAEKQAAQDLYSSQIRMMDEAKEVRARDLDDQLQAVRNHYDDQVSALRAAYGVMANEAELFHKSLMTLAENQYEAQRSALDKERYRFLQLWQFKQQKAQQEYDTRMRQINEELNARISVYQQQLTMLDRLETGEQRDTLEARKAELYAALEVAQTEAGRQDILEDLADVERRLAQSARDEQRQMIQDSIEAARQEAESKQELAKDTYDQQAQIINDTVVAWVTGTDAARAAIRAAWEADTAGMVDYHDLLSQYYDTQQARLAAALQSKLEQIAKERIAAEEAEAAKLAASESRLKQQANDDAEYFRLLMEQYKRDLKAAERLSTAKITLSKLASKAIESGSAADRQAYLDYAQSLDQDLQMELAPDIHNLLSRIPTPQPAMGFMDALGYFADQAWASVAGIFGMAKGGRGVVREPTLFLAGEAGDEAYAFGDQALPQLAPVPVPEPFSGGRGNLVCNFTGPFVGTREDAERFANMIMPALRRKSLGNTGRADW